MASTCCESDALRMFKPAPLQPACAVERPRSGTVDLMQEEFGVGSYCFAAFSCSAGLFIFGRPTSRLGSSRPIGRFHRLGTATQQVCRGGEDEVRQTETLEPYL